MVFFVLVFSEDFCFCVDCCMDIMCGVVILLDIMRRAFEFDQKMFAFVRIFVDENFLLLFGCGYNYVIVFEGVLKVKEVVFFYFEGILVGEMKYGLLALVDEIFFLVVIVTRDFFYFK